MSESVRRTGAIALDLPQTVHFTATCMSPSIVFSTLLPFIYPRGKVTTASDENQPVLSLLTWFILVLGNHIDLSLTAIVKLPSARSVRTSIPIALRHIRVSKNGPHPRIFHEPITNIRGQFAASLSSCSRVC